jgi:hypothetical protein
MKSLLAIGAATALTISASADVTKPTLPTTEEAKALATGSGGGKVDVQDVRLADSDKEHWRQPGDVQSENDIAYNTLAAPTDKLGPIKGESQRALKFDGVDGEGKDREPAAINAGCEPYPACARNKEALEEEIAAPIKSDGFVPVAGAALAKDSGGDKSRYIIGKPTITPASTKPESDAAEVDLDAPRPIGGNDPIPGIDIIVKRCTPYPECDRVDPITAPNPETTDEPAALDPLPMRARPMQRR